MKVDDKNIIDSLNSKYNHVFKVIENDINKYYALYICEKCMMNIDLYNSPGTKNEGYIIDEYGEKFWIAYMNHDKKKNNYLTNLNPKYKEYSINLPSCNEWIIKNIIE